MNHKTALFLISLSLLMIASGDPIMAQESVITAYVDAANKTEDPDKKSELLKMAIEEAESSGKPELVAGPVFLLASAELKDGQEAKAKALFSKAVETFPNDMGKALFNSKAGNEFYYLGKFDDALVFYKQAVRLREKINPPGSRMAHVFAQSLKDLGNCQRDMGDFIAAEVVYKKAIDVAEEAAKNNPKHKYHTARSKIGLAGLRIKQGKPHEAASLAREALGVFEEIDNQPWCGHCLFVLGEAKELEDSKESALALYQKAIEVFDFKGKYEGHGIIVVLEKTVPALRAAGENVEAERLSERLEALRKKYSIAAR
jgi:tetratricopeptide (TPR) repeat protein